MLPNRLWLIADTHLGHDNMVEYCGRPKNHTELILENLSVISEGDILIHLGDFCIGSDKRWHEEFFKRIPNTTRILLRGNHDKKSDGWYMRNGWSFVCETMSNNYFGNTITFSHMPQENPRSLNIHGHYHNNLPRLLNGEYVVEGEKERNDTDFALEKYNGFHKLLSIEYENYKPVLLNKFISK